MILTTSIEWNDRAFVELPSIKKRDTGRQEDAVAGKVSPVLDPAL